MKIIVVDDHALIREALHGMLRMLQRDVIVLDAASASDCLRLAKEETDVGLVLLDLGLPDADGLETLRELRARQSGIDVVVLSASRDRDVISHALSAGARGFIPKSASNAVMLRALELVMSGGIYVPPEMLDAPAPLPDAIAARTDTRVDETALTARQREVLELMMRGHGNKRISRQLGIAEPTVKNHVTAILRAFGASNRTEAVVAATKLANNVSPDRPCDELPDQ